MPTHVGIEQADLSGGPTPTDSMTVPSGCSHAILKTHCYAGGSIQSLSSVTLGGVAAQSITQSTGQTDRTRQTVAVFINPASGTKTLAATWAFSPGAMVGSMEYVSGGDTGGSLGVRDAQCSTEATNEGDARNVTLTTVSGDYASASDGSYAGSPGNETSWSSDATYSGSAFGLGSRERHIAATTTTQVANCQATLNYSQMCGVAIAPAGGDTVTGSGAITVDPVTVAGTGKREAKGTGAITLPLLEVAGTGERTVTGSGAITLPLLEVAGTGTASGETTGSGAITLDSLQVSGTGKRESKGAGAITLDTLVAAGAGKTERKGTGAISLTPLLVDGTGSMFSGIGGSGALTLTPVQVDGTGEVTNTGSGAITLDALQVSGTGTRGVNGSGSIVLGAFEVSGYDVPPTPTTGYRTIGGTAVDQYGRMVTLFIDPTDFSDQYHHIEGLAHDGSGRRVVTTWPGGSRSISGLAIRYDGVQIIAPDGAVRGAISGVPTGARGEMVTSTNMPVRAVEGFGIDAQGRMCVTDQG